MLYHVTERRLLAEIFDQGLLPRIGERSEMCGETTPAIYLFPDLASCDTALSSWLGDTFDDLPEDALVILAIDDHGLSLDASVAYERVAFEPLPASRIRLVLGEDLIPLSGDIEAIALNGSSHA